MPMVRRIGNGGHSADGGASVPDLHRGKLQLPVAPSAWAWAEFHHSPIRPIELYLWTNSMVDRGRSKCGTVLSPAILRYPSGIMKVRWVMREREFAAVGRGLRTCGRVGVCLRKVSAGTAAAPHRSSTAPKQHRTAAPQQSPQIV